MGAYQLFYLDRVPDMAAVDESVSLTRAMGFEALTGLVNGVLRNMIRGKNDVVWPKPQDDAVKYLSIMFSAPEALCEMLVKAYGEHDAMEILRYRPKDRTVTVRVNYLRCDDARLRSLFADDELDFEPGALEGVYKVHGAGDMTRHACIPEWSVYDSGRKLCSCRTHGRREAGSNRAGCLRCAGAEKPLC